MFYSLVRLRNELLHTEPHDSVSCSFLWDELLHVEPFHFHGNHYQRWSQEIEKKSSDANYQREKRV